jgi:hypothetical protein
MTRELLALLAVGAAIALGGRVQAQQPTPAAATPPAATPPATTPPVAPTSSPPSTAKESAAPTNATATAAAPAASTPAPAPDNLLRRARKAGFKPEVRGGVTQYCIKEDKAETGSTFLPAKKCYDEPHLLALLDQRDADRDVLRSMHQNNISSK